MSQTFYQQYLTIKQQYPDTILFFRLGDHCEAFNEDARTVAKVIDTVLASRVVSPSQRVPMASVPFYALDAYVPKLVKAGYKLAICEQVGSEPINGLVPREVVEL